MVFSLERFESLNHWNQLFSNINLRQFIFKSISLSSANSRTLTLNAKTETPNLDNFYCLPPIQATLACDVSHLAPRTVV